jgi:hypothetical protein
MLKKNKIKIFGEKTVLTFFDKKSINRKYCSWLKDKKNLKFSNNKYKTFTDKLLLTLSSTKTEILVSIPALSERYMFRQKYVNIPGDHPQFKSSLNILYISSKPDMEQIKNWTLKELSSCIVSNACGLLTPQSVTKHNLLLDLSQFTFVGVNEDLLTDKIKLECNSFYPYDNIKGDKLKKTLKFLENKFTDEPVHIVFDLEILSQTISPLSFRYDFTLKSEQDKLHGVNLDELYLVLNSLKKLNIVGLDIVNYNLIKDETSIINRIQSETIQKIYGTLLNMSVKSFNVFNENSRFLIFKPLEEIEEDINLEELLA